MYTKARKVGQESKKRFKFKNPLYSIDSSTIDLCLKVFDWALYKRTKGAVKLHLMLEHQSYLPCWAVVTDGKSADITVARTMSLSKGAIVAMDRGYVDFNLFASWTADGVYFVTRIKDRMCYEILESRPVPAKAGRPPMESKAETGSRVLRDETIIFTSQSAKSKCPVPLRLVTIWDKEKLREMAFLSNNFKLSAATISAIYKDRWSIEAFFKAIKQNLKIKTFLGTSENAVKSQIWTALLGILLMKYLQLMAKLGWALSNLIALFRLNILVHRDLWIWLENPNSPSPSSPQEQGSLFDT